MRKKILILIIFVLLLLPLYQINAQVKALNPESGNTIQDLKDTAGEEGIGYKTHGNIDLIEVVIKILKRLLEFLGVFFLILIIMGGYQWMTAGGNEEAIAKAKKRIKTAVIGLAIVLMAYLISSFVTSALMKPTVSIQEEEE